jgi:hypothetical protein
MNPAALSLSPSGFSFPASIPSFAPAIPHTTEVQEYYIQFCRIAGKKTGDALFPWKFTEGACPDGDGHVRPGAEAWIAEGSMTVDPSQRPS